MKKLKSVLSALPTGLLCCMAILASLYCAVTSFELPVNSRFLIGGMFAACLIWVVALQLPHRKISLSTVLLVFAALIYYFRDPIAAGGRTVLNELTSRWSTCYAWCPELCLNNLGGRTEVTALFLAVGTIATMLSLFSILRCNSCWLSMVLTLPFFLISVSLVNHPPAAPALFCLIGALVLLGLTQAVRSANLAVSNRLSLLLAIPICLFCLLLTLFASEDNYQRTKFTNQLLELFTGESFASYSSASKSGSSANKWQTIFTEQNVDFSTLGPIRQDPGVVMEVTAQHDGQLYLRGTSLGDYTHDGWSEAEGWTPAVKELPSPESYAANLTVQITSSFHPITYSDSFLVSAVTKERVTFHMTASHDVVYLPYYAQYIPAGSLISDSYVENTDDTQDYYAEIYVPSSASISDCIAAQDDTMSTDMLEYGSYASQVYTQLPEYTRQAMLELIAQNGIGGDNAEQIAASVADFYQSNGHYTLVPEIMPSGEDFAVWFTSSSMAGYCVHYATSATVMLRAMGIPARYTTGYAVTAKANEAVNVTGLHAHAWVEYYLDGFGWVPLEVTPSGSTATTDPDAPSPTFPSQNPTTPQTTDPTAPSELETHPAAASGQSGSFTWHWWYWLIMAPLAVLFGILLRQWLIRIGRQRRMSSANNAKQAEMLWCQVLRAAKKSGLPTQDVMEQIALKAKYSSHKITNSELAALRSYHKKYLQQVYATFSPGKRLLARWIWVLS